MKIEFPRESPQHKKCQGFNHTPMSSGREPRSVNGVGKHLTQTCSVKRTVTPKCINYKGQYPASYRGCEVAIQLQKLSDKTRKQPRPNT
jgi:hypothetical protein